VFEHVKDIENLDKQIDDLESKLGIKGNDKKKQKFKEKI